MERFGTQVWERCYKNIIMNLLLPERYVQIVVTIGDHQIWYYRNRLCCQVVKKANLEKIYMPETCKHLSLGSRTDRPSAGRLIPLLHTTAVVLANRFSPIGSVVVCLVGRSRPAVSVCPGTGSADRCIIIIIFNGSGTFITAALQAEQLKSWSYILQVWINDSSF